jgi:predicted dehydrogenase
MSVPVLRVGLIGAGGNTRLRHIPGLRSQPNVELAAVCNRRPESTTAAAKEYNIPRTYTDWQDLVRDPDIDALIIGTWPYLHAPITLAALEAGKHVLTEARLAMNLAEARQMLAAAKRHPKLVAQVVPSPYGLYGDDVMTELIRGGWLGELREVQVVSLNGVLADPGAPLSWRQDASLSGINMLTLGIVHETLLRWAPPPVRVLAQAHAFTPERTDSSSGLRRPVGTPDSVQVLAVLEGGARATYHCSGVSPLGQQMSIRLSGSEGVLHYDLLSDRLRGASRRQGHSATTDLYPVPIPKEKVRNWEVEAEFVRAIRGGPPPRFTDFAAGVAYMEFSEAVARSAKLGVALTLPLKED